MRQNRRPRMSLGFGYIGSGNKTSVFTRRPKLPFEKIKEIYGEELEKLNLKKNKQNLSFKKLTIKEKLEIRERVKGQLKKQQRKEGIMGIIVFLIAIGIFILARLLIIGE